MAKRLVSAAKILISVRSGAELCCLDSGSVRPGAAYLLQNSFCRLGWPSVGYIHLDAVRMALKSLAGACLCAVGRVRSDQ